MACEPVAPHISSLPPHPVTSPHIPSPPHTLSQVENTIRWRYSQDEHGNDIRESNARIVRWSDGSMSLYLGSEIFDICRQPLSGEFSHLFVRQGELHTCTHTLSHTHTHTHTHNHTHTHTHTQSHTHNHRHTHLRIKWMLKHCCLLCSSLAEAHQYPGPGGARKHCSGEVCTNALPV